jgi:phage tail-like protein
MTNLIVSPNSALFLPVKTPLVETCTIEKFLETFNRTDQEDPLKVFRFHVEIDNFARFGFSKVSGLKTQTDVIEYREGGQNTTVQKSPGLTKFPNITLERGQVLSAGAGDKDVLVWATQVFDVSSRIAGSTKNFRRSIDVVQYDKEGTEVRRWKIIEAWVVTYTPFTDLDGSSSANSIEVMEIAHEGYRFIQSAGSTV